jgi:hypothetical protein
VPVLAFHFLSLFWELVVVVTVLALHFLSLCEELVVDMTVLALCFLYDNVEVNRNTRDFAAHTNNVLLIVFVLKHNVRL